MIVYIVISYFNYRKDERVYAPAIFTTLKAAEDFIIKCNGGMVEKITEDAFDDNGIGDLFSSCSKCDSHLKTHAIYAGDANGYCTKVFRIFITSIFEDSENNYA